MKLPKIFITEREKGYKKQPKKIDNETLEELVDDENLHDEIGRINIDGQTKISNNVRKYDLITGVKQMTLMGGRKLVNRGLNFESVEKAFSVSYHSPTSSHYKEAIFVQYKDETSLIDNLEEVFLKGMRCETETKFIETFLFKKNIAVYLEGDENFINTFRDYYRKKGFKQLNYKLEAV